MCVAQPECDIAGFSGIPGLLPCLYTLCLYLVCCTVLLWVIMWNPDWCAGHVVCAVISDVHRTLRSHRSLPLGEMEFVCVREKERSWLLFYSSRSEIPPSALLSACLDTITWLTQATYESSTWTDSHKHITQQIKAVTGACKYKHISLDFDFAVPHFHILPMSLEVR